MWKIAIIDDDRLVLRGLKNQIPWKELQAECAGVGMDGEQGLEIVRETRPDLIITDIYMPEMNGLEMILKLRQENYTGKIIIHSGYNDFEYARQALRLNVDDYLSKPISIQTLQTILLRAINELVEEDIKRRDQAELQMKLRRYEPFTSNALLTGASHPPLLNESRKHKETIEFMLQYIQDHYAEDITMSDLADLVYISKNYLSDIFKKMTGETFHSYLTRVRMEKARHLILEGKWHVYEIARLVGYKNVPYFSTAFKKYYGGMNPTELVK